jgi:hypothetical protein
VVECNGAQLHLIRELIAERDEWKRRANTYRCAALRLRACAAERNEMFHSAVDVCSELAVERDAVRARARQAAQLLIEEIGAAGPENVEDTAGRAVAVIRTERSRADKAERELARWSEAFDNAYSSPGDAAAGMARLRERVATLTEPGNIDRLCAKGLTALSACPPFQSVVLEGDPRNEYEIWGHSGDGDELQVCVCYFKDDATAIAERLNGYRPLQERADKAEQGLADVVGERDVFAAERGLLLADSRRLRKAEATLAHVLRALESGATAGDGLQELVETIREALDGGNDG